MVWEAELPEQVRSQAGAWERGDGCKRRATRRNAATEAGTLQRVQTVPLRTFEIVIWAARGRVRLRAVTPNPDIRWKQRFQNFDRAFVLLRQAMENGPDALNQLEKEGATQRFKYCFELAWKTVKDYLEEGGFVFTIITPRQVLNDAFAAKIIGDGQVWSDMLDQRNLLSHTYDFSRFEQAVEAIHARYLASIETLHDFIREEALK